LSEAGAVVVAVLSEADGAAVAAGAAADPAAAAAGAAVVAVALPGAFWASATPIWQDTIATAKAMK